MKKYILVLIFLFIVKITSSADAQSFKVVGYIPAWGDVNIIEYDKLTHINYAFIRPSNDGSGGLDSLNDPSELQSLVSQAHAHGVKVCISVGGGSWCNFAGLASNATARTTFTNNMINFVNTYNLDGVDIDWEFPDGHESEYDLLMNELGVAMHSRGKILTAAVLYVQASCPSSVFGYVDFLNIMAYDMGYPHSEYSNTVWALNYWRVTRGLPKEKAVLGVPFYGKDSAGNYYSYSDLVAQDPQAPYKDNVGGVYYNGIQTIKDKTTLALDQGGGIMIWELSTDTHDGTSLLRAIFEVSQGGTTPYCGDSSCNNGETCSSCPGDCGSCPPEGNWTFCANENQLCSFTGTKEVQYGANGMYAYGNYTNGVQCSNAVFGDPAPNVVKQCYYRDASTTPVCGSNGCETGENCSFCPQDCGACPSQDPVAWWKLDETSGATTSDSSGSGNAGTLKNGPVWTTGKINGALSFDGADDYVQVPDTSSLKPTGAVSFGVWFKTAGYDRNFIVERQKNSWVSYAMYISGNGTSARVGCIIGYDSGVNTYTVTSAATIGNNSWHYAMCVYDKQNLKVFVDGVESESTLGTNSIYYDGSVGVRIGFHYEANTHFNGTIDDVRIYNYALSSNQIQTIYSGTRSDSNSDGCVSQPELMSFISRWYTSNTDVTLKELMEAIGFWKMGGC